MKKLVVMAVTFCSSLALACIPSFTKHTQYLVSVPTSKVLNITIASNETATLELKDIVAPTPGMPRLKVDDPSGVLKLTSSPDGSRVYTIVGENAGRGATVTLTYTAETVSGRVLNTVVKVVTVKQAPRTRGGCP
jgi:hypothetical protein